MYDQAAKLRELAQQFDKDMSGGSLSADLVALNINPRKRSRHKSRVISVTSGKGGVGKTSLVTNLAIALAQRGNKVIIFDADLGLANVDILLDLKARYNLEHVVRGEKSISEIILDGPAGVRVIPASSGIPAMTSLSSFQIGQLIRGFYRLNEEADFILIDTAAGISTNVLSFVLSSDQALVVTTPDPAAITDAYAMIKLIGSEDRQLDISLLVNMVTNANEGMRVAENLSLVSKQFLKVSLDFPGSIPHDMNLSGSNRIRKPFILNKPNSPAAESIHKLAARLSQTSKHQRMAGDLKYFLHKLSYIFSKAKL
jgi:flagellar biosynthesis protein FlhG